MNILIRFLEGKDTDINRIEKSSVLWNMIASMAYSFQSAILLLVVTRVGGLFTAGVFSISYTVSQMFASVGSYSMRSYQVSDVNNKYTFYNYLSSRMISVFVMLVTCFTYSVIKGYGGEKLLVLMLLSFYRAVDAFDDVYHGEIQKKGRLDIAAKILAIRIITASVAFCILFVATDSLVISTVTMMLVAIVISAFLNGMEAKRLNIKSQVDFKGVIRLLIAAFPVCVGAFMYNYLVNSPKYAIDNVLSEEMQTIFNIIFMPVFVISMLAGFVFKPQIYKMGLEWNRPKSNTFLKQITKQVFVILVLTVTIVAAGALLGIPVLSLVYGVDLKEYKGIFLLLLLFGGVAALDAFGDAVITIMRKQVFILAAYLIAVTVDVILMNRLVRVHGLWGAALVYGLSMSIILIIYIFVIISQLMKKRRMGEDNGNKNI